MIVAAQPYTSDNALDMPRNAAAIHARLMNPKNAFKPVVLAIAAPAPVIEISSAKRLPLIRPRWARMAITFDAHVRRYNTYLWIQELQASADLFSLSTAKMTIADIVDDVLADYPQYTVADLRSPRRKRELCLVRQIAMAEVRQQRPDLSLPVIGRWFGGRDHTTVIHAIQKIAAMRAGA